MGCVPHDPLDVVDAAPVVVRGLLIVVVTLLTGPWLLRRRLVSFPDTAVPSAASVLPGARGVMLQAEDGLALGAWHLAPTRADRGITVLGMPGNAGSRALQARVVRRLATVGWRHYPLGPRKPHRMTLRSFHHRPGCP